MSQIDDLLASKLEIPSLSYRVIKRNRLTDFLQTGASRRMTTIIAPAGYGKTTLVIEWLSTLKPTDFRIAWVSIDSSDNKPCWFWSYITASLQRVSQHFHSDPLLKYNSHDVIQLNTLINEIAQISYPIFLVLDNYEAIQDESIHRSLEYLIDHLPDNLHLILCSRIVPPIPLTRLRVQNQLEEITTEDLSFSTEEAYAFLTQLMGLNINSVQAATLRDETEGWITGLKLLALSMQGNSDFQLIQNRLHGNNQQILSYLTEEVLNQQEQVIRDFLIKTSFLNDLSAPLCNAVLGRTDSQDLLERIKQANLFITPLDSQKYWYRYHPLFTQVLNEHLSRLPEEVIRQLHRSACTWFITYGYPDKAASHALIAGDIKRAAEIVDTSAIQAITRMEHRSIIQCINNFSDDMLSIYPMLGIHYALACFAIGCLDLIEPKLHTIESIIQIPRNSWKLGKKGKLIRWEISVIRAILECVQSNLCENVPIIQKLIDHAPKADCYFLGFINHWLAEIYDSIGDFDAAIDRFEQARKFAATNHIYNGMLDSSCGLARIRKKQGRLNEAEKEYQNALDYAIQSNMDYGLVALAKIGLFEIAMERMDKHINHDWIQELTDRFDQIQYGVLTWNDSIRLPIQLVEYYLMIKDTDRAFHYQQIATDNMQQSLGYNGFHSSEFIDMKIRIWSTSGKDIEQSRQIEEEITVNYKNNPANVAEMAALARISLERHMPTKALTILTSLESITQKTGQGERLLETLILKALAFQSKRQTIQAHQTIIQALNLAENEGYMRIFINEGEPMRILLSELQTTFDDNDSNSYSYLKRILITFQNLPETQSSQVSKQTGPIKLVRPPAIPLSEREVEVTQLLLEGKSTKEIALILMISINTTKSHIKNIYRKMGSHTRKVVFQRAEEYGIITKSKASKL